MDNLKRQEKNGGVGDLFSRIQAEHLVLSSSVLLSVQLHVQILTQIPGGFSGGWIRTVTVICHDCCEDMGRSETRIPAGFSPSHPFPEVRSSSVPKECKCSS